MLSSGDSYLSDDADANYYNDYVGGKHVQHCFFRACRFVLVHK